MALEQSSDKVLVGAGLYPSSAHKFVSAVAAEEHPEADDDEAGEDKF